MPNASFFGDSGARHKHRYTCRTESGWWDLNPRSPGPEPGAIPSFATARNDPMSLQDANPYFAYFASDSKAVASRQVRFRCEARNYFVFFRTKSVDNEPLHLESQHSFLPCSHRNLFHPPSQAAWRLSFNSRPRRSAPFVPCAI